MYRKNFALILKRLNICNSRVIADDFFMNDHFETLEFCNMLSNQLGGNDKIPKKVNIVKVKSVLIDEEDNATGISFFRKYKFENNIYTFIVHKYEYNDKITYSVFNNDNKNDSECVLILYMKKGEYCVIESIGSFEKCHSKDSHIGMNYTRTGTLLLKFTLDLIESYLVKEYKIKYIRLKDNSNKICKYVNETIDLDSFYMFTHGDTWYGKYGFVPFDNKKTDELREIEYKKNQNIVKNTLVGNVDLKNVFWKASTELNNFLKKEAISEKTIEKLLSKYADKTIMEFMTILLQKYDVYCSFFFFLYKPLMKKLKMTNLHGITYWKQL